MTGALRSRPRADFERRRVSPLGWLVLLGLIVGFFAIRICLHSG